jgi:gluconate 2-dehydrogenase gamma chain
MKMSRREMLCGLMGFAGALAFPWPLRSEPVRREKSDPPDPPLGEGEWKALDAAMERLLPGALLAGAPAHVRTWLKKDEFASVRREFRLGAMHLNRLAQKEQGKDFASCSMDVQDVLLRRFQEGAVSDKGFKGAAFFQRLLSITVEGFLGDPKYGGNRGQVGWKFIGLCPCWWAPKRLRRLLPSGNGLVD